MKRLKTTIALTLVAAAGTAAVLLKAKPAATATVAAVPVSTPADSFAAAGRVEPASEEIRIGSELDGRLKRVYVDEGDHVRRGEVIAELENADYVSRIAIAKAAIAERQAVLDRSRNGTRSQEREEAQAAVREAEAVLTHARLERDRRQQILDRGAISRTEFDSVANQYEVARARLDAARQRLSLLNEGERQEDIRRAAAELDQARAQLSEAQAIAAKTRVRSPIDGVVLRRNLKTGESVSARSGSPIVTLGDTTRLRVRVDVDENDVAKLSLGSKAYVTANAYGDRKFTGRVVEIGQILGRKNIRTDEPTERADTKILETLVELDPGQRLPVGLRVDAFIQYGATK